MTTCIFCEKETAAKSYPIYAANSSSSSWSNAQSTGTKTVYKDILPLSFAICQDCLQAQITAKTRRKQRQALPLIGAGVAAILIGIIFKTATQSGICLPMLFIVMVTFGWGGGLLAMLPRTRKALERAAQGHRLSEDDLVYVFHGEMQKLAAKNKRNFVCTESHYYRIKTHSQ